MLMNCLKLPLTICFDFAVANCWQMDSVLQILTLYIWLIPFILLNNCLKWSGLMTLNLLYSFLKSLTRAVPCYLCAWLLNVARFWIDKGRDIHFWYKFNKFHLIWIKSYAILYLIWPYRFRLSRFIWLVKSYAIIIQHNIFCKFKLDLLPSKSKITTYRLFNDLMAVFISLWL